MVKNALRKTDGQGFTLIEIVLALLILTIGVLALAQLFIFSTYSNSFAYNASVAVKAAEDTMEKLRGLPFTDPKLAIGGTINATPAACATGCVADQNHVSGIYFTPVIQNGGLTHYQMAVTEFGDANWAQRQFEVRWQVIGYPNPAPAPGSPALRTFVENPYNDNFPTAAADLTNFGPSTPPDLVGPTALLVVVRVIPVNAKNAARLAKRIQMSTVLARP